jgi:hypothetical protein
VRAIRTWRRGSGWLIGLVLGLSGAVALGTSTPPHSALGGRDLRIGPIAGLMVSEHTAPMDITVPLGIELILIQDAMPGDQVSWSGVTSLDPDAERSTATLDCSAAGTFHVSTTTVEAAIPGQPPGAPLLNQLTVIVSQYPASAIILSSPTLEQDDAGTTVAGSSNSPLVMIAPTWYETSVRRDLKGSVSVMPSELAGIIEWRVNGKTGLGAQHYFSISDPGEHQLSVGPMQSPAKVVLSTFETRLETSVEEIRQAILGGQGTVELSIEASADDPATHPSISWRVRTAFGSAGLAADFGAANTLTLADVVLIDDGVPVYQVDLEVCGRRYRITSPSDSQ